MQQIYALNQILEVLENVDVSDIVDSIEDKALQRTSDEQITVADLTGVAVQDIQICKIVSNALN